ncbi:LmbU family transcriptional regulator [Nonomuraea sp. SBT364]|uniref:LmbU family transcriptional regulator n=1 Tax=Nonomuraea sp. SBT364 TaxID=1580530 RepID=UPI00066AF375|nr:LmbU family transcriptional regulator [Nonomuraea sp. SBT364]
MQTGLGLDSRAKPRRLGLALPEKYPFDAWRQLGRQINLIADSSVWWLGDWLVFGEESFPGRYKKAIEQTSLEYQTLRNYAWVARRIPISRRRDKLSFQHHAEVASLPPHEQDLWLDRAEQNNWPRNRLRSELRSARAGEAKQSLATASIVLKVPPEKERLWKTAAVSANQPIDEWITMALDSVAALSVHQLDE